MRPLREMDARGVRGVVFDGDDTLTREGILERVAYDALWRLRDAGFHLAAVTGRPLGWAELFARLWPVDLAIGENGAGWFWRTDDGLARGFFEDEATRSEQGALLARIRERVAAEMPAIEVSDDDWMRRCDLAFDVGEHRRVPPDEVAKLVALIEAEGAHAPVSSVHCHAQPGDWDKAAGSRRALAEVLREDPDDWVFVGDSGNDAAAFAAYERSVGVANVRDHLARLPTAPRFVTDADRGRGFAERADHLLGGDR